MNYSASTELGMAKQAKGSIAAKIGEYKLPEGYDALLVGRRSPVGAIALQRAFYLLIAQPYEHIRLEGVCIESVLVREAVLQRLDKDVIIDFVCQRVTPFMNDVEILYINFDAEISLKDNK